MYAWPQTTTFQTKLKTSWEIKNKRWFGWRLETNTKAVENVRIEFDYEACLQHEKWMEKPTIKNIGDKWQCQNLNGHIALKAPCERNNKKLMKTWKHHKTRKMGWRATMRAWELWKDKKEERKMEWLKCEVNGFKWRIENIFYNDGELGTSFKWQIENIFYNDGELGTSFKWQIENIFYNDGEFGTSFVTIVW